MYAIMRTGGKQYRVQPGDVIRVEKLEQKLGAEFDVTEILLVGGEAPVLGQPLVKNAAVTVVVTKQTKDRKVIIFKKKRRQGYRRFKTHRQPFTELFVKSISVDGKVEKTDAEARVLDVDKIRQERIANRSEHVENTKKSAVAEDSSLGEQIIKKASKEASRSKTKKPAVKKSAAKKSASGKSAAKKKKA